MFSFETRALKENENGELQFDMLPLVYIRYLRFFRWTIHATSAIIWTIALNNKLVKWRKLMRNMIAFFPFLSLTSKKSKCKITTLRLNIANFYFFHQ